MNGTPSTSIGTMTLKSSPTTPSTRNTCSGAGTGAIPPGAYIHRSTRGSPRCGQRSPMAHGELAAESTALKGPDCREWSDGELIFDPGEFDNLDDGHYGFVPWCAGEMHLGILNVLHQVDNTMDMYLLHSRDGIDWEKILGAPPDQSSAADREAMTSS